jgi:FecR protein
MRHRSFLPITLAAALIVAGAIAAPARATDDNLSYARIVRLSYASGDVQMMRADVAAKWEPAFANMPIQQGFTIGTNNGIAEVEFEHGSALWLSKNSVLQFTELALSDGGRITKMTLAQGTASFEAGIQTGDTFSVSSPQFEITSEGKSGFRVDASGSGSSVKVFAGKLSISTSTGTQVVARGETLALNASATDKLAITSNPPRDNWDRWVASRENYLVSGANETLQNADSPFTYGTADLSSYGSWNNVAGCGYGWQPYGVRAGWMPFLDGQWMNYSGLGWTWVSFEPWGWMPYHFGGWSNCGGAGWAWMPGENGFWNPGSVLWYGNGGNVGWAPAPPRGPKHPRNPRVNSPHPAAVAVVMATKNLTKEGRYEVKSSSRTTSSLHEFSSPPLADGKMPTAADSIANRSSANTNGSSTLVPTAANLAMLRASMGGAVPSPVRNLPNTAPPSSTSHSSEATGSLPSTSLANAAVPPSKIPPPPPVRSYAFAPSQPGQASARASSSTSSSGSGFVSSGGSRGGSSSSSSGASSSTGSSSRGSGGSSASGGSAPASGGAGRPH